MSKQFYFKQFSIAEVRNSNIKTILFQVIQFSISTHFSCIWLTDRILSGATTLGQNGLGSDGNKMVPSIHKAPSLLELHHQIV